MKEQIINGIKYRLDEETLTAAVTCLLKGDSIEDYVGDIKIPGTVEFDGVPYCVTSIDEETFFDCKSLTSITIPESVTSIEDGAFRGCDSLTAIVVTEGNSVYDSRYNCNAIIETATNTLICGCQNTIIPNSVKNIGRCAFIDCKSLFSIIIPDSVTSIGVGAFYGCESLLEVTIPDSVKSIKEEAFCNCTSLTSIVIPNSVTTIGKSAFEDCESLTSVTIPCSVTSIGKGGTFQGCTSLKSVQWNAINCTIDKQSNGNYYPPFANLSNIKNFTFGNNVKSIPACLCYELSGLTSIVIPDSITSIGYGAFYHCSSLKAIDIPDSVMIIEACAFLGCKSLKIIALPSNALIIEDGAFADCNSWRVIRYGGTVKQCESRYRYWDQCFHHEIIYCTDGDKQIHW